MIGYSFLALSMPLAAPPGPAAVSFGFVSGVIAAAGKATPFEAGATGALTEGGATGTLSAGGATGTLTEDPC